MEEIDYLISVLKDLSIDMSGAKWSRHCRSLRNACDYHSVDHSAIIQDIYLSRLREIDAERAAVV